MSALNFYTHPFENPTLTVSQHVIIRAVKALSKIEALALIRGAYSVNGEQATLQDALTIYAVIMREAESGG